LRQGAWCQSTQSKESSQVSSRCALHWTPRFVIGKATGPSTKTLPFFTIHHCRPPFGSVRLPWINLRVLAITDTDSCRGTGTGGFGSDGVATRQVSRGGGINGANGPPAGQKV